MTTPISNREPPSGFIEAWDKSTWNVGFIFMWSNVYDCWLDCQIVLTVKPNQTLPEAYESRIGEPMFNDYSIFFAEE